VSNPDELYECLIESDAILAQYAVQKCCVCGSIPSLWQYKEKGGTFSKVMMCPNGDPVLPDDGVSVQDGCLLYMPPMDFYKATRREAIDYWNRWNQAMHEQRRERN
jgi:hypothetical protein